MNNSKRPPFRIALTADFYDEAGEPKFADLGLGLFDGHDDVDVSRFSEHRPEITPDQISGRQGVIVLTPRVTADSLVGCDDLLAIGRFGVGYDTIDVDAWTDELFRDIGHTACQSMLDLSQGQQPSGVLNPELFHSARFRDKWAQVTGLANPLCDVTPSPERGVFRAHGIDSKAANS